MNPIETPPGWTSSRIGDLGEIAGGGTPSTKNPEYWNGEIPWLVPSEVTKCKDLFISRTDRNITTKGLQNCAAKLLPAGSVLMTSRATIGEVVISRIPLCTNQGFVNIICKNDKINNEFLAYWIMRNRNILNAQAHGVTFKEITKSNFRNLSIELPPLPEQRAIARSLRAVQAARDARLIELALERERKAALMEYLFAHGTRGEPTKQTEIGEMPESWEVIKFERIIASSAFGPRFSSDYYDPKGNVATLRTTDIDDEGNINYFSMPFASLDIQDFEQHFLKPNDFLITRSGTCGIAAIFESFDIWRTQG
jgi:type I restriction enzyme S subunit